MDSARAPTYRFFTVQTSKQLASEYGRCSGQIDLRTGEILASVTYGSFQHRESYRLHVDDPVSQFPYTTEDQIIRAAKHAAEQGGHMTRRRIIFICKDGRRYITEEFNGDKIEYAARGQCQDGCDMAWSEIRDLFHEAATYTQFIKANLKAQAAYHSFLGEAGNSGVVRNLRKGREAPAADGLLFVYAEPLATGSRLFETQRTCFTPVPDTLYPACSGHCGELCHGCPLRHSLGQTPDRERLQAEHGWPAAIHTEGEDAYLIGAQTTQDGLEPVYLFPDGQHVQPSRKLHPAEEYYRLRGILRDDPRALSDHCELFCACPTDWYRDLALYAMGRIASAHGLPMTACVQSNHGWAAHHVTKAVFEEQDLFDPYSDAAFLDRAEAILPWYVRRYTKEGDE